MIVQYIEKQRQDTVVTETVHRFTLAEDRPGGLQISTDGVLIRDAILTQVQTDALAAAMAPLSGVPLFAVDEPVCSAAAQKVTRKIVVEHGPASFCFLWSGDLPTAWAPLADIVRTVTAIAQGERIV